MSTAGGFSQFISPVKSDQTDSSNENLHRFVEAYRREHIYLNEDAEKIFICDDLIEEVNGEDNNDDIDDNDDVDCHIRDANVFYKEILSYAGAQNDLIFMRARF